MTKAASFMIVVSLLLSGVQGLAAPIGQDDLARADRVENKLRNDVTDADRRTAEEFYRLAVSMRVRNAGRDWGPVAKAFGESAVHRPGPDALLGYAEARLRSWAEWSNPQPDLPTAKRAALREAQWVYTAALAADAIVRELKPAQRDAVAVWRDCIGGYLDADVRAQACQPLEWIAAP